MKELIQKALNSIGIEPSPAQLDQLKVYSDMLLEWNENINLTRITEPEEIAFKHHADSLTALNTGVFTEGCRAIDIGTGAGFPGLPLAILRPDIHMLLLDSLNKRIAFLDAVIAAIGVTNVTTLHARAEDAAHNTQYRGQFDVALGRAVANLNEQCELSIPFLRVGGHLISYKGAAVNSEVIAVRNALDILGAEHCANIPSGLPDSDHQLTVIRKLRPTPAQYPRSPANIKKRPLF